jgi:hypothetical protein
VDFNRSFNRSYSKPRGDLGEKPDNSRSALAHPTLVNREIGDLDGPLGEQRAEGARAAPSITLLIRRVVQMKARKLTQLGPVVTASYPLYPRRGRSNHFSSWRKRSAASR